MSYKKLLVANRSEIAIRVMRAASELGIRTIAIYAAEVRFSLHRFKAEESYIVGEGKKLIAAYLDIDGSIYRMMASANSFSNITASRVLFGFRKLAQRRLFSTGVPGMEAEHMLVRRCLA